MGERTPKKLMVIVISSIVHYSYDKNNASHLSGRDECLCGALACPCVSSPPPPPPLPTSIGLDIAGGTGSFAAHMAARNVTVLTTGMDINEGMGVRKKGLPYLEAIAMRGLVPLWLPYKVSQSKGRPALVKQ